MWCGNNGTIHEGTLFVSDCLSLFQFRHIKQVIFFTIIIIAYTLHCILQVVVMLCYAEIVLVLRKCCINPNCHGFALFSLILYCIVGVIINDSIGFILILILSYFLLLLFMLFEMLFRCEKKFRCETKFSINS